MLVTLLLGEPVAAILKLPPIYQGTESSCGLACVRTVLEFWGDSGRRPRLVTDIRDGAHPTAIQAALRKADLRVISGEMLPADLGLFARSGRPVITLIQRRGIGHYVVVAGLSRGRVRYHDPMEGMLSLTLGEWTERWRDVDVFGSHYHRFGIVAYP